MISPLQLPHLHHHALLAHQVHCQLPKKVVSLKMKEDKTASRHLLVLQRHQHLRLPLKLRCGFPQCIGRGQSPLFPLVFLFIHFGTPFIFQVSTSKNLQTAQQSHHMGSTQPSQAFLQPSYQILPTMYPNALQPLPSVPQLSSSKANSHIVNQVPAYQNQIIPGGPVPTSQPLPQTSKPCGQWYAPGDNLKEAIVREMPKYKANLQDLSPDEVNTHNIQSYCI